MRDLPGVRHADLALPTGVRVHVAEAGDPGAPPVLCLHGWPQHWLMWRKVIEELSGEARLICPDMRGFGWSGQPIDDDFRKARLAEDAVAILDALDVERALVVGHDWGGWTGYLLAIDHAARLHGLVAASIPHPWQPPARVLRNLPRLAYQLPLVAPVAGPRTMRSPSFTLRVLKSAWGDRSTYDEDAAASFAERLSRPEQARATSRLYRSFQLQEALPGIKQFAGKRLGVPTRLVSGTRDPLGTDFTRDLERHGDDVEVELVDGCGHFLPEERPDRVAALARALLAAV